MIWSTALMVMSLPAPVVCNAKVVPSIVTAPVPLPMLEVPVLDKVVKAPEAAVVAPIWVALIPVAVVLKVEAPVPEVIVRALVPKLKAEAAAPVKLSAPEELTVTTPLPEPMLDVPVEVRVVVLTPVAPVMAPVPEISIEGVSKRVVVKVPVN